MKFKKYYLNENDFDKSKNVTSLDLNGALNLLSYNLENYDRFNFENKLWNIHINMDESLNIFDNNFKDILNLGEAFDLLIEDNKDILSNKNDGLVVNEEIMINEEANDVTILEDVEKEQINKLYSEEEIEKAYEQAIDLFDGEKYDDAIEVLKSAYNSDLDTYYHKHILFLLASCYYEKNQFKEAIGYYEEYIAKYDETYIEEIYYKLALAYEDTDLNKSKEYAEHIKKEFSNSIYNNSKISQIISK